MTDAIDRFNYALAGRDLIDEWAWKMDPCEFDRRGDERRGPVEYRGGVSAGTFVMAVGALALWAFVVTAVVWGAMT